MAHDVYICYSTQANAAAEALCSALESEGIRCWIAPRDILPGMDWGECVTEAIDRSRVLLLIFTEEANASPMIRREVERAVNHGIAVVPLRIEDVRPGRALEYLLSDVSWLDALVPPLGAYFREISHRIKMLLERVEMGSEALPAETVMPCAPVPAPMPVSAPSPAPPPSAPPARSGGGGLFRGLAGLFRRSASVPAADHRAVRTPSVLISEVSAVRPAPLGRASSPAKAASPAGPIPAVSNPMNSGGLRGTPNARVDFSVYAPSHVQPGSSFLLNVWAFLPEQRAEMLERAIGPNHRIEVGSRGGILLPSETPLLLRLRLDSFTVDNPIEPFTWHGQVTNVSFLVSAPAQISPGAHHGEVQLLEGGMLTARFYFEIVVTGANAVGATPSPSQPELRAEWVRSAFASYASHDRDKVVQRVQGITAAGVKVFLDVASLRTGHEWEKQLFHAIDSADVFYLFWSSFARASKNVEKEWRTALEKKGLAFIHPIPIEDPRKAQPPDELSSLHFNDIYLAILKTFAPSG